MSGISSHHFVAPHNSYLFLHGFYPDCVAGEAAKLVFSFYGRLDEMQTVAYEHKCSVSILK